MTRGRIPIITDFASTDLVHLKVDPYGGAPSSQATPVSNFFENIPAELRINIQANSHPLSVVLFGDSITQNNGGSSAATAYYAANGYFTWANALLGAPFTRLYNAGIGGDTTEDMLARIQDDVIAYDPGYCMFLGGTNDVNTMADSIVNITGRLEEIYTILAAAGVRTITSLIPPSDYFIGAKHDVWIGVNAWIAANAPRYGAILADMSTPILDVTTGYPYAGWTDGSHPYPKAAFYMGQALAAAIRPYIVILDPFGWEAINVNPLMLGDAAGLATGYSQSADAPVPTPTKVARTDGKPGEWQQLVSAGRGGTNFKLQTANIDAGWAIGDTVYAQCEVELEGSTDLKLFHLNLKASDAGFAGVYSVWDVYQTDDRADVDVTSFTATMKTPSFVIPATTAHLRLFFTFNGVGTFRVGRNEIKKVS